MSKGFSDIIHLPNLSKEQIELEHQLLVLDEEQYENIVKGLTDNTDFDQDDFEVMLGINGSEDFFNDYYLQALLYTEDYALEHTEINVLNQLYSIEGEVQKLLTKLENLESVAEAAGLRDRYEKCMDAVDSRVAIIMMQSLGHKLDA
jgi:hypothetical protein